MRVRVTDLAENQLAKIYAYIAEDRAIAAEKVLSRIQRAIGLLGEQPLIGRRIRTSDVREWVVPRLPYIIGYRVDAVRQEVLILTVLHGAQDR